MYLSPALLVVPALVSQEASGPDSPHWKGAVHFGLTTTEGNSDTLDVNLLADAERRGVQDRLTSSLFWNFGEADNTADPVKRRTVDNYGGRVKYDYFVNDDLFFLANGSFKVDDIALLDLRYVLGAGAGYQVREDEAFQWSLEAGISYVSEDFQTAGSDADFVAARVGSKLGWSVTETTGFEQVAEILPSLENSEDFVMSWDNRITVKITESWNVMLQYVHDYDNTPAAGQARSDQKFVFTLGWSFGA